MKLYKLSYFIKRDFAIFLSYKMALITSTLGTVFPLLTYFFISKLVPSQGQKGLSEIGGDYFSFVLIGTAFTTYFMMAIQEFSATTRRDQMAGCLEALLSSQTDTKTIIFMSAIFKFIHNGTVLIFMFIVATLFLGFDLSNINIPSAFLTFILSIFVFISLGIFSAGGTILFKRGEPFSIVFGTMSSLLGGAIFPVAILPDYLQTISYLVPIKYSLDALRLSILRGYPIEMLSNQLITLLCIALVLFPLSLIFFEWAVEKGKRLGTLMQY
ncbi:ABC transporter permease [Snuella sedimenti]|uniref:Transport permease protein n=1 Tax=Snuella sedimenti TaxID=2798802 RepID=A0A8J7J010_9FLAO|nr:ABC transporter permease [Snuella sedimenti]MBJ6369815.1 ABC transporter permease [Snuella sedimenti]